MELIFINTGIIVLFLWWGFVLICKSCGADIREEDEDLAWQKYQQSRLRKIKYEEELENRKNTNTRH